MKKRVVLAVACLFFSVGNANAENVDLYNKADSSLKCNSQWWFGITHFHPE
jgi:hypothetical protein